MEVIMHLDLRLLVSRGRRFVGRTVAVKATNTGRDSLVDLIVPSQSQSGSTTRHLRTGQKPKQRHCRGKRLISCPRPKDSTKDSRQYLPCNLQYKAPSPNQLPWWEVTCATDILTFVCICMYPQRYRMPSLVAKPMLLSVGALRLSRSICLWCHSAWYHRGNQSCLNGTHRVSALSDHWSLMRLILP